MNKHFTRDAKNDEVKVAIQKIAFGKLGVFLFIIDFTDSSIGPNFREFA